MQERITKLLGQYKVIGDTTFGLGYKEADELVQAIMAVFDESQQEAFKRGYAQGGIDEILRHEKASQAVTEHEHFWQDGFGMQTGLEVCMQCGADQLKQSKELSND